MSTVTKSTVSVSFPTGAIRRLLRVRFCAGESGRYSALAGVRFEFRPGYVTSVATDGRRLATERVEIDHGLEDVEFIVPAKQARELATGITAASTNVRLDLDSDTLPRKLSWTWRNGSKKDKQASIVPLEGRYPRWRDIVEEKRQIVATWLVSPKLVIDRLPDPARGWLFDVSEDKQAISRQQSANLTCGNVGLVSTVEGNPSQVTLDLDYVTDWLSAIGGNKAPVSIAFHGSDSPVVFTDGPDSRYVLMPMAQDK